MGALTGLRIARRRRSAMRRRVAKKATRKPLDDEIAHLRDLDLHGLRARWKSMLRQQPPSDCLVICCLPFSPTDCRPMSWEISIPPPLDAEAKRNRWRGPKGLAPDGRVRSQKG